MTLPVNKRGLAVICVVAALIGHEKRLAKFVKRAPQFIGVDLRYVMRKVSEAAGLPNRLVVVAAPYGTGKYHALDEVHVRTGAPLIDLESVLSDRMRDLTERQRPLQLPQLLGEVVSGVVGDLVLLDGAEILFQTRLRNPLHLLEDLAKDKTVVVGCVSDGRTISAPNGRRYPIRGFLVACPEANE